MDGQGRWIDNVFIERLWRSLKYEEVYLHAYESGSEAGLGIGKWFEFYNKTLPYSNLIIYYYMGEASRFLGVQGLSKPAGSCRGQSPLPNNTQYKIKLPYSKHGGKDPR